MINTEVIDVAEKICTIYNSIKNKQEWKNIFNKVGTLLQNFEHDINSEMESQLDVIFSTEQMINIAKQSKTESGYELHQVLSERISRSCVDVGMNEAEAKKYAEIFWELLLVQIKEKYINLYNQIYVAEAITRNDKHNEKQEKQLKQLCEIVLNDDSIGKKYRTIEDVEERLKQITNPSLDLKFFDYEDDEFENKMLEKLENDCVYIEGKAREEVFYCTLELLKKNRKVFNKDVFIIDSIDNWEAMRNNVKNSILVPSFFNGEIQPVANNINIFAFGESEHCIKKHKIIMRRRLRNNLQNKLQELGLSYEDAFKTIETTHGLFVSIKRKFFQGRGASYPYWYQNKKSVLEDALLIGSWCDSDAKAIEELMNVKYKEFLNDIAEFTKGEDPFIVIIDKYGEKQYQLANPEEAWEFLEEDINDSKWNQFCERLVSVISTIDEIYNQPIEKRSFAKFIIKEKYSQVIKKGILRSLVLRKNKNKTKYQYQINNVIENILNSISTIDGWCYICNYIEIMCESAPNVVLKRLEKELTNNTGMLEVLGLKTDNSLFTSHYYTHILWAAEYLLQMPEMVVRAVRWYLGINDLNIQYSISNSPKETLRQVFCPWHHESSLNEKGIIDMATVAVEKFKEGWKIIANELPTTRGETICGSLSKPRYLNILEEEHAVTVQEMNNINVAYIELCLANANIDANRWKKLIKDYSFRYYGFEDSAMTRLKEYIVTIGDEDKRIIKNTIREEIYRNRYFANSEWALSEDSVKKLENIYYQISFDNPIWDFTYMFETAKYEFPLLHPQLYNNKDNYSFDKEYKFTDKFITSQMEIFKEKKYSLIDLIDNVKRTYMDSLGEYIAKIYSNNKFDKMITSELLERTEKSNAFVGYARVLYKNGGSEELQKVIDLAIAMRINKSAIAQLCGIQIYDVSKGETIIDKLSENIQSAYWKGYNHLFADNYETCKNVIGKVLKYSNADAFFEYLQRSDKYLSGKDYLLYLKEFMRKEDMQIKASMSDYYLEKIFKKIYQEYNGKFELYVDISIVELYFRGVLPWHKLKCFVYLLKSEPDYYAQMINIVYLHEGEERENISIEKQNIIKNLYSFYYDIKFCPCANDVGDIDLNRLENWVNRFKELLDNQKQSNLFIAELGKLFANSPKGKDGYKPHESVRKIIEKLDDEELSKTYRIAIYNSRGVYSPDAGVTETKLAEDYKNNANAIRIQYPVTAEIYDRISDQYYAEAAIERKAAEDGRF